MFKLITLKPMLSKAFVHYFRFSHRSNTNPHVEIHVKPFRYHAWQSKTLTLNFVSLVIKILLLHPIPQWIYLLCHLTHVFTHKSFSMPSYRNCLNLGDLITFQRVILTNSQFTMFKLAVCSKKRFLFGKLSSLLLRIRFT